MISLDSAVTLRRYPAVARVAGTWFHRQVPWDICLIFFVLGVVVPWRGRLRLRQLLARPYVETRERISLYLSTIVFQWFAAAVAAWRASVHGFRWAEMGLATPSRSIVLGGVIGAGGLAVLQWFNLRRMGRADDRAQGMRALAKRILPQSKAELVAFLALAVTAGVCEEFLYRGFAIAAFARVGLPAWLVVLITAGLFGLAHLYQGRGGLFGTMILGIVFGAIRVSYTSLVPVVVSHAAIDIVAGIAGPRYLLSANDRLTGISDVKSVT